MKKNLKNKHPLMKSIFTTLIDLPTPASISYMWNWGSMLGATLIIQITSGIMLTSYYSSDINTAFSSIIHISRNIESGWMIRTLHMNGASLFFIMIFIHISRGMMLSSFKFKWVWTSGIVILFMIMAIAFLGYVLPWGQMSFWAATVITNLVSTIPISGNLMMQWLWGGFSISQATLTRFFSLHFLLPFIVMLMIIIHLKSLHQLGSSFPLGMNPNLDKMNFHPFFTNKDLMSTMMMVIMFLYFWMTNPYMTMEPENFNPANPLNTPIHIQPEWYFLFAYAILRSIPNKLGGVIALTMSISLISILYLNKTLIKSKKLIPLSKMSTWMYFNIFFILTWIGSKPMEQPYENIGKTMSMTYFSMLMIMCFYIIVLKTM